jgi:hypothetical protein
VVHDEEYSAEDEGKEYTYIPQILWFFIPLQRLYFWQLKQGLRHKHALTFFPKILNLFKGN